MADTDTPETDAKKPVTRRRAPRKVSAPKSVAATSTAKPVATSKPAAIAKPVAEKPASPTSRKVAAKPVPKPRSTKRSTPRPAATRPPVAKATLTTTTDKVAGKWGAAAIFGGIAVAGAAVGALLTLRGSTPKPAKPEDGHAHQAGASDASKSFEAGITNDGATPE